MAWIISINTIFLFQQIKYINKRIKSILLYNINLDQRNLILYSVSFYRRKVSDFNMILVMLQILDHSN